MRKTTAVKALLWTLVVIGVALGWYSQFQAAPAGMITFYAHELESAELPEKRRTEILNELQTLGIQQERALNVPLALGIAVIAIATILFALTRTSSSKIAP